MFEAHKEQRILEDVRTMIAGIIGQDVDLNDREIALDTSFNRDLELESIEFVVLSEQLQNRYGREIDFAGWLAGKELQDIINLRVGDVVRFIEQCH
ncbi:MAG TPA: acyl carrier protein [Oligoflexus sp.]|uniref:acyl carrier protein n=1 Tax=Oligoflexus sp. TaxID=1971216 RepID=UPI002D7EF223|nr:acyl carrier protein [Oligoflexus sp.]HET9241598.1 acyl carrier protein [Oligoflexus sp.]